MDPQFAATRNSQVQEFQRRHHTELITMLFSDVVGSTTLKQTFGDRVAVASLQRHDALIREVLTRFDKAEEIATAGDSFFIVFARPSDAVKFSLIVQASLRQLAAESGRRVFDRIGIHVGEVWVSDDNLPGEHRQLYGLQVDTCARVASLGEADQILMTRFAFDSARQVLKSEELEGVGPLSWLDHGPYMLKGVEESLDIFEVGEMGLAALDRPKDAEKAHRVVSPDSEPVLGWRPAIDQVVPNTNWIVEKKLGEGGFGEVWLGHDKTAETHEVFKFCFRADRVRSLKREVTLFRLLKERVGHHPNIVGVKNVNFDEPPFYIVMDFKGGEESLAAWCAAHGGVDKVPLATRLEIVAQVCDALQVAQGAGIIHRDIKPSNILVSGDGTTPAEVHVRLTDFGIGQVINQESLASLTRAGFTQTLGSPGSSPPAGTQLYMAPELLAGQPATTGADIYSLGVVLYQLVVGNLSAPVTIDWISHISDPLLRDDLARALAGDPHQRFPGAGQLGANLRSLENRRASLAVEQAAVVAKENKRYHWGVIRAAALDTPLLALLTAWALFFNEGDGTSYDFASAYHISLYAFMCVVVAMYFGVSAGIRALARDRLVLLRDGLLRSEIAGYIAKRTLLLALFVAMQCALLVLIGNSILEIRGMFRFYFAMTFLTGLCGIALGLLFSSLVRSKEGATRIMWLIMIPQIVFGGALIKHEEMNRDLDFVSGFQRWLARQEPGVTAPQIRDNSTPQVPFVFNFIPTRFSYEALIVAQATLNPFAIRQMHLQRQIDALVGKSELTESDLAHLEELKDTLTLLNGLRARDVRDMKRRLNRVDAVINGQPLDTGGLRSRPGGKPGDESFSVERQFTNQRVSSLVEKAEIQQNDFRRLKSINTFFSPEKHYDLPSLGNDRPPVKIGTVLNSTLVLLAYSLGATWVLYVVLQRQLRGKIVRPANQQVMARRFLPMPS